MSCQRCGQEFGCSREDIDRCWCAAEPYRLPMKLPPEAGGFSGCLCPSCLRAVAEPARIRLNRIEKRHLSRSGRFRLCVVIVWRGLPSCFRPMEGR